MTKKRKILIVDDEISLIESLKLAITQFEVVTATTVAGAVRMLLKDTDISFIVADMKLAKGRKGYAVFQDLFIKGKSVPGIVFTGYEVQKKIQEMLYAFGIEEIIPKTGKKDKLYQRIEIAAKKIISSRKKRFLIVTKRIELLELENIKMKFDGTTKMLKEWLNEIFSKQYDYETEERLKDKMVQICNKNGAPEGGHPYIFPQVGDTSN